MNPHEPKTHLKRSSTSWRRLWLLLFACTLCGAAELSAQAPEINVTPEPQEITFFDQTFEINPGTRIVLSKNASKADEFAANLLAQYIDEMASIRVGVLPERQADSQSNIIYLGYFGQDSPRLASLSDFVDSAKERLGEEGYFLRATDSLVVVLANGAPGFFYGCMTLRGLLDKNGDRVQVPGVTITDWPGLKLRGLTENVSQGRVPNLDTFKKTIRFMAERKMNTYFLYLGSRFRFQNLSRFKEEQVTLTEREVTEIQSYAKDYHVEIVPMIECLTNLEELLVAPDFIHLAEFPGSGSITPALEETYQFLDEIIFEISQAFQSSYLHVGQIGHYRASSQASRATVAANGLGYILEQHFSRVYDIAKRNDKRIMLGTDVLAKHPLLLYKLPGDVVFTNAGHPRAVKEIRAKDASAILTMDVRSRGGLFPDYTATSAQLIELASLASSAEAAGAMLADTDSSLGFSFHEYIYYGYALAAECFWSPASVDLENFNRKFFKEFFGTNADEAELVHSLFLDLGELAPWSRMWQHPLSAKTEPSMEYAFARLKARMFQALNLLDHLSLKATRNKEHIGYLRIAAKQAIWLANKIETARKISRANPSDIQIPANGRPDQVIQLCFNLVDQLNRLQEDFQLLWARDYHGERLSLILDAFSAQIEYWQQIIESRQQGKPPPDPRLSSQWISHPPQAGTERVGHAFFRKTFEVASGFRKAYLQVIADSHLKVYLNDNFLDEVFFFDPGSALSHSQNVRVWDVSPILRAGKNAVAVEAWNYQAGSSAGLNLLGQIDYEFGQTQILRSDPYWKTSTELAPNWTSLGFFDVQWLNAMPTPKDLIIIRPNLRVSRPSRIEHH